MGPSHHAMDTALVLSLLGKEGSPWAGISVIANSPLICYLQNQDLVTPLSPDAHHLLMSLRRSPTYTASKLKSAGIRCLPTFLTTPLVPAYSSVKDTVLPRETLT